MAMEWFAALGPLVISWTLRTALICAIALVAVRLLERRSAALRHGVLTAAIAACLALPVFSTVGLTVFMPRAAVTWIRGGVKRIAPAPNVSGEANTVPRPDLDALLESPRPATASRTAILVGSLGLSWFAGALLLGLRAAISRLAAARMRRRARLADDPALLALFARVGAQQEVNTLPELRISGRIAAPATLGCWRAAVLLPEVTSHWTPEQLQPVLVHELSHVVRRDCLTTLFGEVACALFWCNPLVWIVSRRQRVERERACDDRALATGIEPTRYGLLLLDVARSAYSNAPLPSSVLMMARPKELESRLLAIVRGPDIARDRLTRRGIVAIALAATLVGSIAASHAPPDAVTIATDTAQQSRREPDRRGDSLASPSSERIPFTTDVPALERQVRSSALWTGPDGALVRRLLSFLPHVAESPDELGRERAIWALSQARGDGLTEPLLEALGNSDWRVRAYAAYALSLTRERRAVPLLIVALQDRVWRLRAMAAWTLVEIGDVRALPAMTRAMNDEAWQVRWAAVSFVAQHANPVVTARLLESSLNDRHVAVRTAASDALTRHTR